MKTSVTVLGSCISNASLKYAIRHSKMSFLVKKVGIFNNLITFDEKAIPHCEEIINGMNFEGQEDVFIRSEKLGLTKDLKSFCKGTYLILDLGAIDNAIICIKNEKGETFYSTVGWNLWNRHDNYNKFLEILKRNGCTMSIRQMNPSFENIRFKLSRLEIFLKQIKEIYDASHIVLVGERLCNELITTRNEWEQDAVSIGEKDLKQKNMERAFLEQFIIDYLELPKSHYIVPLDVSVAYENKGAVLAEHFIDEVYAYTYNAIEIITDELPENQTIQKLNELYRTTERLISEKITQAKENSLKRFSDLKKTSTYELDWLYYLSKHTGNYLDNLVQYYQLKKPQNDALRNVRDFDLYFEELAHRSCIILISIRGKARGMTFFKGEFIEIARDLMNLGQIEQGLLKGSYCAMIDAATGIVEENLDTVHPKAMLTTNFECSGSCYQVRLESKKRTLDDHYGWAKIMINNIDYAVNSGRLNMVVFDRKENKVIDSLWVDTDNNLIIRRER
jgi:hypothetical protein